MFSAEFSSLSDERLLTELSNLVRRERRTTLDVLLHLNEVEKRRLHLKQGYGSLFAYCTGRLGYSESAAGRRVQTARCIRRFPVIAQMLEAGSVNLSTVTKVAGILMSDGDAGLLTRIQGKSQREVEAIIAERRPRSVLRDRVKPVCVRVPAGGGVARETVSSPLGSAAGHRPAPRGSSSVVSLDSVSHTAECASTRRHSRCGSEADDERAPASGDSRCGSNAKPQDRTSVAFDHRFMVQFVAGPELMKKLDQVRALLSFKLPANASMEELFDLVLEEFLSRNSPSKRRERRVKRQSGSAVEVGDRVGRGNPRGIAASVRDDVLVQSGNRCSYIGANGRRCGARQHLQIDHVVPVARGGTGERANLRVLCAAHNRLEAERIMGAGTTARYTRRE